MGQSVCEASGFSPCGFSSHSSFSRKRAEGAWQSNLRSAKRRNAGHAAFSTHPSIGVGVSELRITDRAGIYRAFYYMQSPRGILVFHAFMKKSQATPQRELDLARKRWKELLYEKI
jgi:phage-related protein